jgi:hypothetical protein
LVESRRGRGGSEPERPEGGRKTAERGGKQLEGVSGKERGLKTKETVFF